MAANGIEDFTELLHAEEVNVLSIMTLLKEQGINMPARELNGEYTYPLNCLDGRIVHASS